MDTKTELELLRNQSLLEGLSDERIISLFEHSEEEKFAPNQIIFEEGAQTTDLYIILDGQVSVLKWDGEHSTQVLIDKITKGETFGEMSFMDGSPRSATIKAAKPLTLLKLSKDKLSATKDILTQIYANIALINIKRLRNSNERYVKNLQELQWVNKTQKNIGAFVIFQYLAMGAIFAWMGPTAAYYIPWALGLVVAFFLIRSYGFDFSRFGLHFKNFFSVIATSLLAVAAVLGIVWFSTPISEALSLPNLAFKWSPEQNIVPLSQWIFLAIYCFSQEFVARGVLQTGLQDFLNDAKGYKALFINVIFLFIFLLLMGTETAIKFGLLGIPMGLIYLKQKNIFGVFLIHFLLAVLGILSAT